MSESSSKYALKRLGKIVTRGVTKERRRCTKCSQPLAGRRGHGFPTRDGRGVTCGGCATKPTIHMPPPSFNTEKILGRHHGN